MPRRSCTPRPRGARAPGSSAPTALAVPPPLRLQPAPPGTADGARQRRKRPRGGWLRLGASREFPRRAQRDQSHGPAAQEDVAAARGGRVGPLDALQVGARRSAGAETWAEFAGSAWRGGGRRCPRAPLPARPGTERAG